MMSVRKNRLTEINEQKIESSDPLVQEHVLSARTVLCEICGKNKVPRKAHFRCYYCGKYTCFDCAHYQAVFLKEPLSMRARSMRICRPNCKIKTRLTSDLP